MAGNPNPNRSGLKPPFSTENQPKNRGRKPSKLKAFVEHNDLTSDDVTMLAKMIVDKKEDELKSMIKDESNPMLARLFVRLFLEDWKTGRFDNLSKILDRAVGPVVNKSELSTKNDKPIAVQMVTLSEVVNGNKSKS